jgi:SAM-dependent methyltransferase
VRRGHGAEVLGFPAGYSDRDGTVEFFGRVQALIPEKGVVVDFGCGRGKWREDSCDHRRKLQDLRVSARLVLGVDVDWALREHTGVDARVLLGEDCRLPLQSASVDVVVADWVLEHLNEPGRFSSEVKRVLRPGGWLCARTPNRWGYVGLAARSVPSAWHGVVLRRVQRDRCIRDVFPTKYRLNTLGAVEEAFPSESWTNRSYMFNPDIDYVGSARWARQALECWQRLAPRGLSTDLFVFVQRKDAMHARSSGRLAG